MAASAKEMRWLRAAAVVILASGFASKTQSTRCSCTVARDDVRICTHYTGSKWVATQVKEACLAVSGTYLAGHCDRVGLLARCEVPSMAEAGGYESVDYYYAPTDLGIARKVCVSHGGEFIAQ